LKELSHAEISPDELIRQWSVRIADRLGATLQRETRAEAENQAIREGPLQRQVSRAWRLRR
jgi:hypothetical protein